MGAWGTRVYEDDAALDVRSDFLEQHLHDEDIDTIESNIQSEHMGLTDQGEDDVVWLALCCVELETGTLTDKTKHEALEVINSGRQYELWLEEAGKEDAALRKRELTLIRKYIDGYTGKPVKRKSWVELQKDDDPAAGVGSPATPIEKLDDVSWHGNDRNDNINDDIAYMQAGAHIACFEYWIFTRSYYPNENESLHKMVKSSIENGGLSASQYMLNQTDGKLCDIDVSPTVRDFVIAYYTTTKGSYFDDYERYVTEIGKKLYRFIPSEKDCENVAQIIDKRLEEYKKSPYLPVVPKVRRFNWKFWLALAVCVVCLAIAIALKIYLIIHASNE